MKTTGTAAKQKLVIVRFIIYTSSFPTMTWEKVSSESLFIYEVLHTLELNKNKVITALCPLFLTGILSDLTAVSVFGDNALRKNEPVC